MGRGCVNERRRGLRQQGAVCDRQRAWAGLITQQGVGVRACMHDGSSWCSPWVVDVGGSSSRRECKARRVRWRPRFCSRALVTISASAARSRV